MTGLESESPWKLIKVGMRTSITTSLVSGSGWHRLLILLAGRKQKVVLQRRLQAVLISRLPFPVNRGIELITKDISPPI